MTLFLAGSIATASLILAVVCALKALRRRAELEEATWPARYKAWRQGRGQIHVNDVLANRITLEELIPSPRKP